ncbi:MAG TPA: hypothetical protein VF230_00860 [Acidimicrobiales bacterium]
MAAIRMVPLVTVGNGFHARVLAARLGAAGVVTQLRGAVDGPYPIGDVRVDVPEDEVDLARQLLLADEVEAAFDEPGRRRPRSRSSVARSVAAWAVFGGAVASEAIAIATHLT